MRFLPALPLLLTMLLSAARSQAQQLPAAPDSAARPAALGQVDVIVRTNGDELPARVLRVTPELVRYLPPPAADGYSAPTDTLQLKSAQLLHPATDTLSAVPALVGLNHAQRYERGRQDGRSHYKPAKGVFWGTFASTAAGPAGVVVGTTVALARPGRHKLHAPEPALLDDPAYLDGYRQQARQQKLGKAAAGLGAGAIMFGLVYTVVAIILTNNMFNGLFNMY